jgi:hypothetical protein
MELSSTMPPRPAHQPAADRLREVCGQPAVQVEHPVQLRGSELQERADRRQRRVADEQADVELIDGRQDRGCRVGCRGVEDHRARFDAVGRPQLRRDRGEELRPPGHQRHVEAAGREPGGERLADAVGRTDHERPRPVPLKQPQPGHGVPPERR